MIMDSRLEFADALALNTGGADNYLIGNQIPLTIARDVGNGQPVYFHLSVDTDVDSAADGVTLQFQVRSDDSAAVDPDTGTIHVASPVFAQATLVSGFHWCVPLPLEGNAYEEFLGLVQITAVEAATAGKINAWIDLDPHGWKAYPDAVN